MKKFSYLLLAAATIFGLGSCKQSNSSAPTQDDKQTVAVSVTIPGGVRAAISDYADALGNGAEAKVEKLHVYLTNEEGKILESKEFSKANDAEWKQITSTIATGKDESTGGYKFLDVDKNVRLAYVFANPQGDLGAKGSNVRATEVFHTLPLATDVVYADSKRIEQVGGEPFGVNPQADSKAKVSKVELTIQANMNRFQITGAKFQRIAWKDDAAKVAAKKWQEEWLDKNSGDVAAAFAEHVGQYNFAKGDYTNEAEWTKYFTLVDVTDQVSGVIMNHFYNDFVAYNKYVPTTSLLWAKHYADSYDFATGKFEPLKGGDGDKVDATDFASFFATEPFAIPENKAVAFNFFPQADIDYTKTAPTLHFIFKEGKVNTQSRFINIAGYTAEDGKDVSNIKDQSAGYLINLDLAKLNGGNGILVDMDEDIPGGIVPEGQGPNGTDDIVPEKFNLIVRVEFKAWVARNVLPIINK